MFSCCSPDRGENTKGEREAASPEMTLEDQITETAVQGLDQEQAAPTLQQTAETAASDVISVVLKPGSLGLNATFPEGIVTEVFDGQGKAAGIKPGWVFTQVDGEPFTEKMLKEKAAGNNEYLATFSKEGEMDTFVVSLQKPQAKTPLGVDIDTKRSIGHVTITNIKEGIIAKWNRENPGKAIKAASRIVAVNGTVGTRDMLLQEIGKSTKLELSIAVPKGTGKTVLIVATSATIMGTHTTGAWSEEVCGPYYTFKDAGCDVTVCSVSGGDIPIDQASVRDAFFTENDKRMIDEEGSLPLKGTKAVKDFDVAKFDIVFFAGGHGTCVDFCTDSMGEVAAQAMSAGKVVAAVCHGPMAFVNAKIDGQPIVKGKKVACFTDDEEKQVGLTEKVPFLLESKMKELGALTQTGAAWTPVAVKDGKLVTGQNPQSSVKCARLAITA
jgi:putative intracellular protease/amidase